MRWLETPPGTPGSMQVGASPYTGKWAKLQMRQKLPGGMDFMLEWTDWQDVLFTPMSATNA